MWGSKVALRKHRLLAQGAAGLGRASMPWARSKEREEGARDTVMDLQEEKVARSKQCWRNLPPLKCTQGCPVAVGISAGAPQHEVTSRELH